jgi:EmrB/QacA subfamily drug resistance transporter
MSITESDVAHGDSTELYLDPEIHRRRWWILVVLCLSLMIVFIGNSSLNVAIPRLAEDFHATTSQLQWVVASYSLVFAGLLFTTGAIGDRFGRKGVLQLGLAGFLVGVVLASMATEMWQLIACRALMGASAAFIMPSTLSILVNVFAPGERAKAIAIWAGITGAAGAIGPVASGWLLGHFWFGSVFLVNVPFIAVALVAGALLVPRSRDPQHADLDPIGAILSIIGVSSLVYALIQAPEDGWASASTLIAFAVAAVVIAAFVAWEMHVEVPMLDMSFFKNPAFSTGSAGMILVFLAMFGVMFLVTQYFQLVLGYSPLGASLRLLPMTPIMIVVAPLTPRMVARFGANRTVSFGLGLVALGFLLFRGLEIDTSYAYVLLCVFPLVAGIAMAMSPMTAALMSAVPARRAGVGSAMNDATRELGAALGIAVLGSVAASRYARSVDHLRGVPAAAKEVARDSLGGALVTAENIGGAAGRALATGSQQAFVDGMHVAVLFGAVLSVIAAVLVYRFLPVQTPMVGGHGEVDAVDAAELTAELGIAGVPPLLDDGPSGGRAFDPVSMN